MKKSVYLQHNFLGRIYIYVHRKYVSNRHFKIMILKTKKIKKNKTKYLDTHNDHIFKYFLRLYIK